MLVSQTLDHMYGTSELYNVQNLLMRTTCIGTWRLQWEAPSSTQRSSSHTRTHSLHHSYLLSFCCPGGWGMSRWVSALCSPKFLVCAQRQGCLCSVIHQRYFCNFGVSYTTQTKKIAINAHSLHSIFIYWTDWSKNKMVKNQTRTNPEYTHSYTVFGQIN